VFCAIKSILLYYFNILKKKKRGNLLFKLIGLVNAPIANSVKKSVLSYNLNMTNKAVFYFYFITLGLLCSVWQMLFLREALTSFRGNELFLNYFLICWLIASGLGGLIGFKKIRPGLLGKFLGFYYFLVGVCAVTFFLLIRLLPQLLNFTTEVPGLLTSLFVLPIILFPVALFLGIGFSAGTKYFVNYFSQAMPLNINLAYLAEIGGFFTGSLLFNFWLIKIPALNLLFLVLFSGLVVGFFLLFVRSQSVNKFLFVFLGLLIIFLIGFLASGQAKALEFKTANWRLPKEKLLKSVNSHFGNIAISVKNDQFNFYAQGSLIAPAQDFQTSEELIHLPLLFVNKPQKILIIGNAWNGFLKEALKYPDLEIFYAETNPEILPTIQIFLNLNQRNELANWRVHLINQEAIAYLKNNRTAFDLILLNVASPTTYQANRYFTQEFFTLAKQRLTPQGALCASLAYQPENLTNPSVNRFLGSIFGPFTKVFRNNFLIPGQKLIIVGLADDQVTHPIKSLVVNFAQKKLDTIFLSVRQVEYLLTNERQNQILSTIKQYSSITNRDWAPLGVILQIINQSQINQVGFSNFLNWFFLNRYFVLTALILGVLLVIYLIKKRCKTDIVKLKMLALLVGPINLILEILIVFIWQVTFGYIYHQISLIIGLVMLGIFLINWQLYFKAPRDRKKTLEILILLSSTLAIVLLVFLLIINHLPFWLTKTLLLLFALFSGYLAGGIYPLANYLYLEKRPAPLEETGKIYGLELLGGGLLLILTVLFVLPFFGLLVLVGFIIYWLALGYFLSVAR
jgi:spermidine synthase